MPAFVARWAAMLGRGWQRWRGPGARGERIARAYLRKQGCSILARNLRLGKQEIDILAQSQDGRTVIICEVKTTIARPPHEDACDSNQPMHASASTIALLRVDRRKQDHLVRAAHRLQKQAAFQARAFRFDVITVVLQAGRKPVVKHIPGAFESRY